MITLYTLKKGHIASLLLEDRDILLQPMIRVGTLPINDSSVNLDLFSQNLAIRQVISWTLVTACRSLVLILPKLGIERSPWESYIAINGREGTRDQGQLLKLTFILLKVAQNGMTLLVDISLCGTVPRK